MNSMTGFGRAQLSSRLGRLTVEIASVNYRYLDVSVRLPRQLASLELRVRELVSSQVTRGNVTVNIGLDDVGGSTGRFSVNRTAAKAYVQQLRSLQKELKLEGDITLHDLIMLPEVAGSESQPLDLDEIWGFFGKGLTKALAELAAMRAREGQAMQKDMHKRLQLLRKTITSIRKQTSNAVQVYRDKLAARIHELLEPSQRANLRIEEEVAIFAERTDITEECTRFISHIEQYDEALKAQEPIGKRLNFILQEMNREANTIGSKCSDFSITALVISLKEEVEKLRELVQNVE